MNRKWRLRVWSGGRLNAIKCAIETPFNRIKHLVDLLFGDDQGRAEGKRIAKDVAHDDTFLLAQLCRVGRNALFWIKGRF